jgi:hypothetical protein
MRCSIQKSSFATQDGNFYEIQSYSIAIVSSLAELVLVIVVVVTYTLYHWLKLLVRPAKSVQGIAEPHFFIFSLFLHFT